jgi:purine-nucleoside phosphorylase
MQGLYEMAVAAAAAVRTRDGRQPRLGLVLGSGLGPLADRVEAATRLPYTAIPGLAPTSVSGHAGQLVLGELEGQTVAVLRGRVHLYEGHPAGQVVLPVLLLWQLGVAGVILTNAAGGISAAFGEGALMLIADHINLTGYNPLIGPEDPRISQRFVDLTAVYDPAWRALARRVAGQTGTPLHEGIYLGLTGPSFETPAEIRMAARLGADAVGMSTVLEAIMARAVGLRVLGLSCITNLAAGLGGPISHEDVSRVAARVGQAFETLVRGIVRHDDELPPPPAARGGDTAPA